MTKKTTKTTKRPTAAPANDRIDPRVKLLARVAGNIAGVLIADPTETSTPASIAAVAVDLAEQILLKAGVAPSDATA